MRGKTYWLVGASEGLGRALAHEMDAAGARLILSARSARRLEELAAGLNNPARVVVCDVASSASITKAAADIGDIDGLIYCAGSYWPMRAGEWDRQKAEIICDVNFMGAVRVLGHVVPKFVAKDAGHVVLIGSLAGYRGLPGSIGYGSSKAGLMHLAESIRADLWRTKVKVQLINPGFIQTRLSDKNSFAMPFLMSTEVAARRVQKAMQSHRFHHAFPLIFSLVFRCGRVLPDWLYNRLFAA